MKRCLITALVLAGLVASASAEVSVTRPSAGGVELYFEPGAGGAWESVRPGVAASDRLNPDGDLLGDGWPALDVHPVAGWPNAAWATGGEDRAIVFSWHDGTRWTAAKSLSSPGGHDRLPVLASDSFGNRVVAWARSVEGQELVLVTALSADDADQGPVLEASERHDTARRPVLAVHSDDVAYLAYEELSGGDDPTVWLAIDRIELERATNGCLSDSGERPIDIARSATIATGASPDEPLRAQIHVEGDSLWVDWNEGAGLLGWVELTEGGFTSPMFVSIQEAGSARAARDEIRELVLLAP